MILTPSRAVRLGHVFALLSLVPGLASCGGADHEQARKDADLTLLYTTDVHGQMLPYEFLTKETDYNSMADVYTYVRQAREANPDGCILVDNGDLLEGSTSMYYYNYVGIREKHLAARVMNFMGYDALNLGNHDVEGGEYIYRDHLRRAFDMPWLCANAIDTRTNEPMFKPFTIIERKGYRIAIVGFITPDVPMWVPQLTIPHLRFDNMQKVAADLLPRIEEQYHPDFVIGMFHADSEREVPQSAPSAEGAADGTVVSTGALSVVRSVRGFDLVLMGHDHKRLNTMVVNAFGDTIGVLQTADHCEEIGRVDIRLTDRLAANGHRRAECRLSSVRTADYAPDTTFMATFGYEIDHINNYLDRPIGTIRHDLDGEASLVGPSSLMDLVHSVQLKMTDADISLASCLSCFSHIEQGELTMRQLFAIYKYENLLEPMEMRGREVKQFLEFGYGRQFNQMTGPSDHLLSFVTDASGKVRMDRFGPVMLTPQYNFTSAAGINYTVDVSQPVGHRVKILSMADGSAFEPDGTYAVVMSAYQAAGGGGFLTQGLGWSRSEIQTRTIRTTTNDMCYFISYYVRKFGESDRQAIGHWRVLPEAWWAAAKDRDLELLVPWVRK